MSRTVLSPFQNKASLALPVKNNRRAADQRYFDFPEMRLFYSFQSWVSLILSAAKKILSRGDATFLKVA